MATGDKSNNQSRRSIESRRALRGIEHPESARSPCPDINQPTSGLYTLSDHLDGSRDVRQNPLDGSHDLQVLAVHQHRDLDRIHLIDRNRFRVVLFGG